jgi:hypothetical protein
MRRGGECMVGVCGGEWKGIAFRAFMVGWESG